MVNLKKATCKNCGSLLSTQDRTAKVPVVQKAEPAQVVVVRETRTEGEFKQHGILCLYCKSVTPLGNKKCQACKKKLNLNPRTTVYYNGIKEAIQCHKCGKYTEFKGLKCEYCGKTLKF